MLRESGKPYSCGSNNRLPERIIAFSKTGPLLNGSWFHQGISRAGSKFVVHSVREDLIVAKENLRNRPLDLELK